MGRPLKTAVGTGAGCVAAFIFAALVFIAPWAYGGVEEWFRGFAAVLLAIATAAATTAYLVRDGSGTPLKAAAATFSPAGILLLIAALQWTGSELLDRPSLPLDTISPAATRLAAAGLLAGLACVILGAILFSRKLELHALLGACLASAATVAFLGIAMRITGDDRVIRGVAVYGDPFARFVNRNNAAAFMLLGVASGLALLRSIGCDSSSENGEKRFGDGWKRIDRSTVFAVTLTLTILCLAGILASRSRGGVVAATAAVTTGLPVYRRRGIVNRIALLIPVAVAAWGLVAWLGLSEETFQRFRSLSFADVSTTGRIPHWIDAAHAMRARPVFGAGLGTYGYAYQEHSRRHSDYWYEHADNQFVELAVEAGLAGIGALILGIVITGLALAKAASQPTERVLLASLIVGQLIHAAFDYGIIVPAVAMPAAALWAAVVTRLLSQRSPFQKQFRLWPQRIFIAAFGSAVVVGLVWGSQEHRAAWAVDRASVTAGRLSKPEQFSPEELSVRIEALSSALVDRSDDAEGHRSLAQLYVYRYRSAAFEALRGADPNLDPKIAWRATSLVALHQATTSLARAGAVAGIDAMRRDLITQRDLIPARIHYAAARESCPRLPGILLPLNALRFTSQGEDVTSTTELEAARILFPSDAGQMRTAGRMAWHAGNIDVAERCWSTAFTLSEQGFGSTIGRLFQEAGASTAVELTLPEDEKAALSLVFVPEVLQEPQLQLEVGRRLDGMARRLPEGLLKRRLAATATWFQGDIDAASDAFLAAVAHAPFDASLRAEFARFQWSSGDKSAALNELTVAITLAPERDDLRRLYAAWVASRRQP